MNRTTKLVVLGVAAGLLALADFSTEAPLGLRVAREAAAIVGAPATPGSVAGVARRTTRRTVAVTTTAAAASSSQQQQATAQQQQQTAQQQQAVAQQQAATAQQQAAIAQQQAAAAGPPPVGTVVAALPAGCVSSPKGGVQYYSCGGVTYRAAFQGNNLVYVVDKP